jgi:Zn-dependent protease with chaperone function
MHDRVHPMEPICFALAAALSVMVYLMLLLTPVGIAYLGIGALVGLILNGLFVGHVRGSAVRVSERQFPDVHAEVVRLARVLGMEEVPAVYVLQAGGTLNAFATRFLGRSYVVLFSDVVELARSQGEQALAFVIAHELTHHQRGHTGWKRLLTLPAHWMPFVGSAYSRACEYTCDAHGADVCPEGAVAGLLVLAAGKQLYREIDPEAYARQSEQEGGFWVRFAELMASHPNLPKRVAAVRVIVARQGPAAAPADPALVGA